MIRLARSPAPWMAVVLACLLFAAAARAQRACPPGDCACLVALGDSLENAGNLTGAIRLYTAAKECEPDSVIALNRRIETVFARIEGLRRQAYEDEYQASRNTAQAAALQARAERDFAQAAEARKTADLQRREAIQARARAAANQATLDSLQGVLNRQTDSTRQTLLRLDRALDDLAREYARQADRQIYQLNYDSAQTLAGKASALRRAAMDTTLQRLYLEITYVYNEANDSITASRMTDSLAIWYRRPVVHYTSREALRADLAKLDSAGFDLLERRYYPVMVLVKGGTFLMGTTREQRRRVVKEYSKLKEGKNAKSAMEDEMPAHPVTIDGFLMAQTETTWWQYGLYCIGRKTDFPESPTWGRQGDNPVVNVSWDDIQGYNGWLNARKNGNYSLPTEAEWEYAARGGVQGAKDNYNYAGADSLNEVGWYLQNAGDRTRPVAVKAPNQIGLYDLSGNVKEWCVDWYGPYSKIAKFNPTEVSQSDYDRCIRGGSWSGIRFSCRLANRSRWYPSNGEDDIGFRVVRNIGVR